MKMSSIVTNKKRGCNYTALERQLLLEIVNEHIHILENKKTTGEMVKKKRECWWKVAEQYNAQAMTGLRTWKQLRHLYENMKQKTKNNVATNNIATNNVATNNIKVEFVEKRNLIEPDTVRSEINNTLQKKARLPKYTNVRDQYFKIKLANARLERKCMLEKHKLEIELLQIKLNRFRKKKCVMYLY